MKRVAAAALIATAVAASVPTLTSPASAATALAGYSASAEAAVVRIGVYEPAVPIPAEPQLDAGIGFARATTATGPSARAVASYLWPGDAVGDGLGVLLGDESLDYPVKTTSSFPPTEAGPPQNAIQINRGNGMSTAADGSTTRATVVGLGLGNGIGDPGSGLCALVKQCGKQPPVKVDLPDPIAASATVENLKSQTTVVLEDDRIIATARSTASGISVLGGLVTVDALDLRSESSSDATTGSAEGTLNIAGLRILGESVDLGDPVSIGGRPTKLPKLPPALERLGITLAYLEHAKAEEGAQGSLAARGLTITLDVAPLRDLLGLGGVAGPLDPALSSIDQLGPVLSGLLKLGTKIVVTVGDVRTRASATPAYTPGPAAPVPSAPVGTTSQPPLGTAPLPGFIAGGPVAVTPPLLTGTPTSIVLPGLGRVPTWFVLLGLAAAALVGWAVRGFGVWIYGGGNCLLGKTVGVPDLRKARSP